MALAIQGVGMAVGDSLCTTTATVTIPQALCRRRHCHVTFFLRASPSAPLVLGKANTALSTRPSRWPKLHKEISALNRALPAQPSSSSSQEERDDREIRRGGDGLGTAAKEEEEENDDKKERNSPEFPELEEGERKRRLRISSAKKGRVPWNKGKTHKPETIERIRKTLKKVMNKPEVREKLKFCSHPHSEETKEKLRQIMLAKNRAKKIQLSCLDDWRESIAEAARVGGYGEEELQWNSYMILKEALIREEKASMEEARRKRRSAPRKPLSEERKKKISKSVKARWEDLKFQSKTVTIMCESKNDLHLAFSKASNIKEKDVVLTKVGCYNDPKKQEKLQKLKHLKAIILKSKERFSNVENTPANTSEHSMLQCGQIYQTVSHSRKMEIAQATLDTTSLKSYHKARAKAQMEATKRAIILMEKAKSAATAAAKALEQSNTKDEKVESSLEMALDLIKDAHKSIKTVQFQG